MTSFDIEISGPPGPPADTAAIANDSVTNGKLANMAAGTVKGRAPGAGAGDPTDLTLDTDSTMAANSDSIVPTQKAVKSAIAAAVLGLWDPKGGQDCSANPNYPAALKGDQYFVQVAGKIGGASGTSVDVGDVFVAMADNAGGTQASVGSSWLVLEHNLVGALAAALASTTEQLTGTDASKVSTPDSVAALWEQGADVASAGTVSLGEGGYFNITGTTTITDIDFATDKAGRKAWVKFAGILTLTHNSSTLILPSGANIATAAGDTACFVSEGSDVVRCVAYQKANGQAVVGGAGGGSAWNLQFGPLDNEPPSANYATLDTRNGHPVLNFDASTAESAVFTGILPNDYSGAGLTVTIFWAGATATSGNVMWQVAFEACAAGSQDTDSDGFATAQAFAAAAANGSSGVLTKTSLNVSNGANMDSIAAGDMFRIKITRDAANGSDTMTGDAQLARAMLVSQ